jgi:hypothetical protein
MVTLPKIYIIGIKYDLKVEIDLNFEKMLIKGIKNFKTMFKRGLISLNDVI